MTQVALVLGYAAAIGALISWKPLREFSVLAWNPFVSLQFFAAAAVVVVLLHALKAPLARIVPHPRLLALLNALFFAFMFVSPAHLFLFTGYFYLNHRFAAGARFKYAKATALFLTILPLVISRSAKEVTFIGLSYMTFRAFHLVMDRERTGVPRADDYFLFLTFFPAVMAGPIDRFARFKSDLDRGYRNLTAEGLGRGLNFVLIGLAQKFVFAEIVSTYGLAHRGTGFLSRLFDMYAYGVFLYLDFAGYSAMAVGLGYMLGVFLPQNFNHPYLAESPPEFWRRFHITLGQFLKEYFFLPIYRLLQYRPSLKEWPLLKQNVALMLTFLLMGYWNGSRRHFLLCGFLFGLYSVIHNSYVYWTKRGVLPDVLRRLGRTGYVLGLLLNLHAAAFALYVFSGRLL